MLSNNTEYISCLSHNSLPSYTQNISWLDTALLVIPPSFSFLTKQYCIKVTLCLVCDTSKTSLFILLVCQITDLSSYSL